jgi:microcystin-dependent protein
MSSRNREFFNLAAHQRPMVGDTKTSALVVDHLGWLFCDGRQLAVSDYRFLFDVIGYSFGGNGSNIFRLPNPAGRIPGFVTQLDASGNPLGTRDMNNDPLTVRDMGDETGEETHTLIINEMPAHKHGSVDVSGNTNGDGNTTINGSHTHTGTTDPAGNAIESEYVYNSLTPLNANVSGDGTHSHILNINSNGDHQHTMGSTGGDAPHNNMQPTLFLGNLFIYSGKNISMGPTLTYYPFTKGLYAGVNASPTSGSNIV